MRNFFKIFIILLSFNPAAHANLSPDGMTVSAMAWWGNWSGDREGARLATRWDWEKIWFKDSSVWLRGYWEGSTAYWSTKYPYQEGTDHLWAFAFSPVFQLMPRMEANDTWVPFLEIGIGLAVFTKNHLGDRELGSAVQFEDRLGLGFKFGPELQYELSYRYMHYSNAGLFTPNNGLDWNSINLSWIWG